MPVAPSVPRIAHRARVLSLLREFPVVTLMGARQVGKTTLAHQVAKAWRGHSNFFDLESP
jgi:predicted AAA+ superfamily ATPase